jgi:hypothetical protein
MTRVLLAALALAWLATFYTFAFRHGYRRGHRAGVAAAAALAWPEPKR